MYHGAMFPLNRRLSAKPESGLNKYILEENIMPRTAGSRNSENCHFCLGARLEGDPARRFEARIIVRDTGAIDYDKAIGQMGAHTCIHFKNMATTGWRHPYADNLTAFGVVGYYGGQRTSVEQYRHEYSATRNTTTEPTPEPATTIDVTFTDPQVQPSTVEGDIDVVGALNTIFNGQISSLETRFREVLATGLLETVEASTEYTDTAARNIVDTMMLMDERINDIKANQPVVHNINVTVNNEPTMSVEGRPHANLETIIKQISRQHHLWMCGPAGSGKTTAAKQAAKAMGLPFQEISCGPATSQYDLFGFITPDGRYQEGLIRKMYEEGGVLMLDEIDNTNPSVLTAMNNVLANGEATFPDGTVKRHPKFVCLAGANTYGRGFDRMYVGRNQIDGASIDRFRFMEFNYDEEAEIEWAGRDQRNWVKYVQAIRAAATERRLQVIVSPRASIFGAEDLREGDSWDDTANGWIWNKLAQADKETLQGVVRMSDYQRS